MREFFLFLGSVLYFYQQGVSKKTFLIKLEFFAKKCLYQSVDYLQKYFEYTNKNSDRITVSTQMCSKLKKYLPTYFY